MAQTDRSGWLPILNKPGDHIGREVYIKAENYPAFEQVHNKHRTHFSFMQFARALKKINADPYFGLGSRTDNTQRELKNHDFTIYYYLDHGDILIEYVRFDAFRRTGLYLNEQNDRNEWQTKPNQLDLLPLDETVGSDNGQAHYAAVGGKFSAFGRAEQLLPEHIHGAYCLKKGLLTAGNFKEKVGAKHSLFWFESESSFDDTRAINKIAEQIRYANQQNKAVHWLVHEEAARPFLKAVELAASESVTAENKHKVFFSNPTEKLDIHGTAGLLAKAGIEWNAKTDVHSNGRNLRNVNMPTAKILKDYGKGFAKRNKDNLKKVMNGEASLGDAADTLMAELKINDMKGKADKFFETLGKAKLALATGSTSAGLAMSDLASIWADGAACATATVAVYKTLKGTSNTARATHQCSSANGVGNEFWYSDDTTLLKDIKKLNMV